MKKMPSQFYMFVIVLCCYFWPWYLSFFEPDADALLTVILLQSFVVMSCNKLVKEDWAMGIILVESVTLSYNLLYFGGLISQSHSQVMLSALIIELLIITISLTREKVNDASRSLYGSNLRIWSAGGNLVAKNRGGALV